MHAPSSKHWFWLEGDYGHWNHATKRNVDPSLTLGQHLAFLQNLGGIDLDFMDNMDCPIKGQEV